MWKKNKALFVLLAEKEKNNDANFLKNILHWLNVLNKQKIRVLPMKLNWEKENV